MKSNSPFWYKSGRFLWGTFVVGVVIITVSTGPLLYKQYEVVQSKKERVTEMKQIIAQQKESVSLSNQPLRLPTNDELLLLQQRVPTEVDTPLFLKQIQEKATAAGVQWKGAQFGSSSEQLDEKIEKKQLDDPKEEKVEKKSTLTSILGYQPLRSPYLKEMWVDLYVDADLAQLKNWFEQLKGLEQVVRIEGWENQLVSIDGGNTRVRLSFLVYQDTGLKIAPNQQEMLVPQPSSELIQVLPPSHKLKTDQKGSPDPVPSGKDTTPPTGTDQKQEPTNQKNVTTPSL
ncbi:hypothetical protein [Hazenella coriacea]|uniref:Uncharacterized protein n=1 Tax=Hazenella coriacea TaxID=1179467 RepID=A0A4R3LG79_9BACL|nr:hypothetical protein [Hazenella coriacea]TCS96506.1 hypothetical protein EDD58_101139 [Hazenella coriacea]